jgi:PPE-repeat protein
MELITAPLANIVSQLLGMLGPLGTSLATELQTFLAALSPAVSSLTTLLSSTPVTTAMSVAQIGMYPASALISPMMVLAQTAGQGAPALAGATNLAVELPNVASSAVPMVPPLAGLGVASAALGQARWVGAISVPPTWQGAMPAPVAGSAISVLGAPIPTAGAAAGTTGTNGNMRPMPMPVKGKDEPDGKSGAVMRRGGPRPAVVRSRPKVVPRSGAK